MTSAWIAALVTEFLSTDETRKESILHPTFRAGAGHHHANQSLSMLERVRQVRKELEVWKDTEEVKDLERQLETTSLRKEGH